MFNLKTSCIIAGLAFILSFLIGVISGSSFPAVILRPFVFSIFFFLFSGLISLVVGRFLPELLEEKTAKTNPELVIPGARINITEDTPAVPGMVYASPDESDEEVGDISLVIKDKEKPADSIEEVQGLPGMDQTGQSGYNSKGVSASSSGSGDSFDALPDLESLVGAFLPSSAKEEEVIQEYSSSEPVRRSVTGNKPSKMETDFNPKELAAGIRTVLKKDEG